MGVNLVMLHSLGALVRPPNFNFSAPFDPEIAATLLIHPLLVGVAGISRANGACLQGEIEMADTERSLDMLALFFFYRCSG